jgi:hypothetical protein
LFVFIKLGPIESHNNLLSLSDNEADPESEEAFERDLLITQETIDLFGGVLWVSAFGSSEGPTDGMNGEDRAMENVQNAIGKRKNSLGVKVVAKDFINKI